MYTNENTTKTDNLDTAGKFIYTISACAVGMSVGCQLDRIPSLSSNEIATWIAIISLFFMSLGIRAQK